MMLLFVLLITLSIMCCKLCNFREPQLVSWEDGGRKLCKYAHYEFVPKRKLCAGKHEPLNHPEKQHSRVQPLDATAADSNHDMADNKRSSGAGVLFQTNHWENAIPRHQETPRKSFNKKYYCGWCYYRKLARRNLTKPTSS